MTTTGVVAEQVLTGVAMTTTGVVAGQNDCRNPRHLPTQILL